MPSIVSNFEYDIFISYRHNDNRSGWVTEFVNALQEELASTIKEPLTIYFDRNPHNGLLETHNVDKSLEGKLKCLIFIPILSQTYCDPNSFAWKQEFCVFNKMAIEGAPLSSGEGQGVRSFGRDVKLTNGNFASRILPIKIHDLDSSDKTTIETEIGGVLRAIEFVFKSQGVNRPLRATEDHPQDNQNKTFYRDQINKVANAIKELIVAMQQPVVIKASSQKSNTNINTVPSSNRKKLSIVAVAVLLIGLLTFSLFYFLDWGSKLDPKIDKSIAVLPFKNMSGDKEQAYFSDGMMDEILNQLVKIGDLKVSSRTSSMQYRDSKLLLKDIARELSVAHVLEGSVQKSGDRVRIIVQLIDAATDKHLWSESYDKNLSDVFAIQTEISKSIAQQLNIVLSPADKKQIEYIPTTNQQAYDYYLKALSNDRDGKNEEIAPLLDQAILLDSTFANAYALRASTYGLWFFNGWKDWEDKAQRAKDDLNKAIRLAPDLVDVKISHAWVLYLTERKYDESISILEGLKQKYPKNTELYQAMGAVQRRKGLWRESIESYNKALMLDSNGGNLNYEAARLYSAVRDYDKAIFHYHKAGVRDYSYLILFHKGELSGGLQLLEESFKRTGNIGYRRQAYYYYKKEFKKLLEGDNGIQEYSDYAGDLTYANVYYLMKDVASTKKYGARAVEALLKESKKSPENYYLLQAVGEAYAYAGECEKAIEAGKKALQLMPVSRDAFKDGPENELSLAKIYLICERHDEGLDKIEYLLTIPAADDANISVGLLKIDPFYDKLRNLPRFQKILKTEYKTVY